VVSETFPKKYIYITEKYGGEKRDKKRYISYIKLAESENDTRVPLVIVSVQSPGGHAGIT